MSLNWYLNNGFLDFKSIVEYIESLKLFDIAMYSSFGENLNKLSELIFCFEIGILLFTDDEDIDIIDILFFY